MIISKSFQGTSRLSIQYPGSHHSHHLSYSKTVCKGPLCNEGKGLLSRIVASAEENMSSRFTDWDGLKGKGNITIYLDKAFKAEQSCEPNN